MIVGREALDEKILQVPAEAFFTTSCGRSSGVSVLWYHCTSADYY